MYEGKEKEAAQEVIDNGSKYSKHFSEESFFSKIVKYGKAAGAKVVFAALLLFYAMKSDKMPMTEKALVVAALGYFILPIDLIPDFIPVVGYADDLTALYVALKKVTSYIDNDIINQARGKLTDWFGIVDENDIQSVLNTLL
ncbi:DUF1232 domain-containing protein [bacterium]|nr:DUF1232 domain-containing protein [bacterium]MBP5202898.1 DUF1232 domain-containing protein [bacterium]